MSGFEFHIVCRHCGLASSTYPFRYDRIVPSSVELPRADRVQQAFGRFSAPIDRQLTDEDLVALAAAQSTADATVLVPSLRDDGVALAPETACPRCGALALEAPFGRAPKVIPNVTTLVDLIARARAAQPGELVTLRFANPPAVIRCTRSDDGRTFGWHVTKIEGGDITTLVASLIALLGAQGGTCSEPRAARGYTEFDETRI